MYGEALWRGFENKKGFTIIELVIVLALLMLVGGITMAYQPSQSRRNLYNAALALQGDIRQAQRLAIIEGRDYQVKFNETANKYTLQYQVPRTSQYKRVKEVFLAEGVTFKSVNTQFIEYGPRGTNNKAFTLILQNDAYTLSMTANVGAGRIAVKEIKKKPL